MSALAQTNREAAASAALAEISRPAPELRGERIELPEGKQREADERFAVIWPLVEFMKRPPSQRVRAERGLWIRTPEAMVEFLASQSFPFHRWKKEPGKKRELVLVQERVAKKTIWNWYRRYRAAEKKHADGKLGLARPVRSDKGTPRIFAGNPKAAEYVLAKYLHEKLSNLSLIHESLCGEWPGLGYGDPPSFNTVRRYLASQPKPFVTLAQEGPRAYLAKRAPFIQRVAPPVMDTWVSDHRELDVLVRNSMFAQLAAQQMYTLWLTAIYDWGSRKLLGFVFAPTPSSRTLGSAFSMAAFTAGAIAPNFYWDNGEDYKRFERILLAPELTAIFNSNVTRARPYNPRSKPVESWFNRWSQRFDLLWRPAWRGRKPGQCPEDCREAQKQHKEFLAGKRERSRLPLDSDFILAAMQWIEEYNAAPHPKLDGRSPNEAFDVGHPLEKRGQLDRRLLDVLFWQREERKVLQGGCVELLNARYEPTDETLLSMDGLQGQRVIVKYDPYNLGHALALDLDGRLVGELRAQKFLTQSAHGRVSADDIRVAERRKAKLLRHYRGGLQSLALVSHAMDWKGEAAQLVARGRARFALPATGTDGAIAQAAPGAGTSFQPSDAGPRVKTWACDVTDEDAALVEGVELED